MMQRRITIPKKAENPIDIAILLTIKYGSSRKALQSINREIDNRIDQINGNDIVRLSAETLQWNLVRAFVEDISYDKARMAIKRLKTTTKI